jgi:hypothetical protein
MAVGPPCRAAKQRTSRANQRAIFFMRIAWCDGKPDSRQLSKQAQRGQVSSKPYGRNPRFSRAAAYRNMLQAIEQRWRRWFAKVMPRRCLSLCDLLV